MNKKLIFNFAISILFITNFSFSQTGILDITYGINGQTSNSFGPNCQSYDSEIQPDGKILVVGGDNYSNASGSSCIITRYLPNGTVDNSFGNNGITSILIDDYCVGNGIALQNDGKIIVAGTSFKPSGNILSGEIMILRLNNDGSLDTSFGTNGVTSISLNYPQTINSVAIQSDGKIVAGGAFANLTNPIMDTFGLIRLLNNGNVDTSFGTNGYTYTSGISRGRILDLKLTETDEIIAVGDSPYYGKHLIVKYDSNGNIDNNFGLNGNGIVQGQINDISTFKKCFIKNTAIYAVGATYNSVKYNAMITKYNLNGIIDNSFGNNGLIIKDFGTNLSSFADDLNFDSNNNLLVGYSYGPTSNYDFGLESYNTNGILNLNFGVNGLFSTNFGAGHDYFRSLSIQNDNKIIMVGNKGNQITCRVTNDNNLIATNFVTTNSLKVFPNPVIDFITLEIDNLDNLVLSIELFNINGKLVKILEKGSPVSNSFFTKNYNFTDLKCGLYFLKIIKKKNEAPTYIKIIK